ncbi:hypothetical protein CEK69_16145 [Xanthomonas sp. LMG 12462]|nr:hypothetical protein CEK69_16145 [Xanthomonas sp. LMG 12462]
MRFLVHGDLRLLGRNCPAPPPSRRSASCQGSETATGRKRAHRHAQPLTARTPWYVRGNGNSAHPSPKRSQDRQAERAGAAHRAGPEASAERSEGTMDARQARDPRTAGLDAQHDSVARPSHGRGRP